MLLNFILLKTVGDRMLDEPKSGDWTISGYGSTKGGVSVVAPNALANRIIT